MRNIITIIGLLLVAFGLIWFLSSQQEKSEESSILSTDKQSESILTQEMSSSVLEGKILDLDVESIPPEIVEKILVPFFGQGVPVEEYPALKYFDKNILVVQFLPPKGPACQLFKFYDLTSKTMIYSSSDDGDCYRSVIIDDSRIIFGGSKQISVWSVGERYPDVIPTSILNDGETYSSGSECMGECITVKLVDGSIKADVYKDTGSESNGESLREFTF